MTASLLWGCGSADADRAAPADSTTPTDSLFPPAPDDDIADAEETVDAGDLAGVECDTYAIRQCSVDLGTYNGVHSCASGVQYCVDGEWGPCEEGSMEDQ